MTTAAPLTQLVRHLRQKTELHPFENLPDAELLERFRTQGDVEAFAAMVRRHGLGVLAACRKVLTSDADVAIVAAPFDGAPRSLCGRPSCEPATPGRLPGAVAVFRW